MLALAAALVPEREVVIAGWPGTGLLERAAAAGFAILRLDGEGDATRLSRLAPDLLHVHAGIGWEGHGLARLGHAADIPVIVRTEHLPYLLTDPEQQAEHRTGLALVDATICVSQAAAESVRAAGLAHPRLRTIPNGVAAPRAPADRAAVRRGLGLPSDTAVILTVARFTPQKGHATLLAAWPDIAREALGATLLLVGDGPTRPESEAAAAGFAAVRFLGNRDDVPDLMAAADLLVLPSRFEGLPLVVLEAMAAGLAVVATDTPGTAEAVIGGETGLLVPPDDAPALARAVAAALDDATARGRMAEAGRARWRQRFTAARMARDTLDLYDEAVGTRPHDREHHVDQVRLGFIGAGGIAHRHFGQLETFPDVRIVAITDTDAGRAEAAAGRFGARAFADHKAMLDAVELDAVYICVPPFAHGAPERDCVARGLPIFVEKPVALDLETAEDIAAAIARKGLVSAVGYHWRYLDTVDEARALLSHNPAQLVSGYWLDSTPPPRWWWKQAGSGGQIIEQTTHLLDLARFVLGDVAQVYGQASHKERPDFPDLDIPTATTASLTFRSGVVANFASTCLLGWNHRVGLHVFADRLAIELTDRDIMVDVGRGRPVRGADGDPVWREDRAFLDAVKGGEDRIRCTYADALATHRIAHAVLESARSGEAIRIAPEAPRRDPPPLLHPPRPAAPGPAPGFRHVRSLGVERPGEAYLWGYDEGPPGEGLVRLDTLYTGFSAGTELTFVKNTNPYLHSRWDGERGVFVPGEAGMHYPVPFMGYMEVARVSESRAPGFAPGDVVATTFGHKSGHTANPFHDLLVKLPAGMDPLLGIYVGQMGPIAANGILHADAEAFGGSVATLGQSLAGRPTLVIGAGVVGLFTALFAQRAGASEVVIADPSPFRRARAAALGLTAMEEPHAVDYAKAAWHHGGPDRGSDVVFQTRADAGSLHAALRALRPQGVVIDLAFYQGGAETLRLGEEFHHNGLAIRCAQIGRVPRGLGAAWDRRRLAGETVALLRQRGEDIRREMITQVVPFEEAPGFLRTLVAERPDFLQIAFAV